ncbi:excalibur calcium-binding domain-containing protein [Neobacillus massiliamazoniensis]|uniref:Excalibur domain family protein n=1 Tax=Neobacillus massiliamazoniensis TaxID=1499688 RepID=A0A0U1P3E9_9BACI|nr:excalibur calcium-binding domain-containing protein [Neobacillus massiliamazoniensis]CRK84673.1 excalibur domain family protein [Neobacillus massiliamazoniensis]
MATFFSWVGFIITAYFLVSGINGIRKRNPKATKNFFLMIVGIIIWLLATGNSAFIILFALGFVLFLVFLVTAIISLFKRNGKAKKQFLMMAGAMVVCIGSAAMIPNDKKETKVEATQVKKKVADEAEKKAAAIAKQKAKEEAELKAKQEAEQKAKEEAELKAKQEAEQKAKEEAELKAKQEAEAKAKEEAELKAKQEAEANAKAQAEADAKAKAEAGAAATPVQTTENSFANCTELRKVYPNGVPSTHPAYRAKLDRDHDNWACERD